jgi:hypothetical protein
LPPLDRALEAPDEARIHRFELLARPRTLQLVARLE